MSLQGRNKRANNASHSTGIQEFWDWKLATFWCYEGSILLSHLKIYCYTVTKNPSRLKSVIIPKNCLLNRYSPCLPLVMSTYWQSLGWVIVLRIWNLPRIFMELGVRGRPLLPQTSCGRAEAKKVEAPITVSFKGNIFFTQS